MSSIERPTHQAHSALRTPHSAIFLVGFMASGKSTVGPLLAAKLGRRFIDLDQRIAAQAQSTIFDLIQQAGEEGFRLLETQTLREAALGEAAVIAPGGGAITRAENFELMQRYGTLIWLAAPFELCWQRIQRDGVTRPLAPDEATARTRYEQRLPLYRQASLQIAITEQMTAAQIAEECWRRLQNRD
jgi:shikimate kinase